ncbi:unnamed protein product [Rotaria socialis]|uniref:Uncharacterized protein n=1 Tax=Rotaria socialis TaxID=392032 RepID=A0A817QT04_9BILA|nr:unnamed protein product [Rotaria socialis]CAF3494647.1 unnamed protein product [Rotaria socialis]CAF4152400.1 unnamed protein product [Rotaria socialis]CAF4461280.1 unnamed protein product [Rotaria socialis]CAF4466275.1 unnamed protein product [Rotaria socialis]
MNAIIVLCVCILLPACAALNCYSCTNIGCSDPFNSGAIGVSTTGAVSSNTYCTKIVNSGTVVRGGASSCTAVAFVLNTGIACCQTDLCNGASANYETPLLLTFSVVVVLIKIYSA